MNSEPDNLQSAPLFSVGAADVDAGDLVTRIRETVARKMEQGLYNDPRVARAERSNLVNLQDDDAFLALYLDCLRHAVFVDINDFEIRERRQWLQVLSLPLKKGIWKLLKFYTYRLWTQQNEVNGLLLTAVEGVAGKYENRIKALETRLASLEGRLGRESRWREPRCGNATHVGRGPTSFTGKAEGCPPPSA
ncbi:MAG: hypothetical protein HY343_00790 [Lentisphaerae bacterium]|nr:hypothetical protein [Lentisphaerota bacterium]